MSQGQSDLVFLMTLSCFSSSHIPAFWPENTHGLTRHSCLRGAPLSLVSPLTRSDLPCRKGCGTL